MMATRKKDFKAQERKIVMIAGFLTCPSRVRTIQVLQTKPKAPTETIFAFYRFVLKMSKTLRLSLCRDEMIHILNAFLKTFLSEMSETDVYLLRHKVV